MEDCDPFGRRSLASRKFSSILTLPFAKALYKVASIYILSICGLQSSVAAWLETLGSFISVV